MNLDAARLERFRLGVALILINEPSMDRPFRE
jgi:hypothetical protein